MNPSRNEVEIIPGMTARATFEVAAKIEALAGKGIMALLRGAADGSGLPLALSAQIVRIGVAGTGAQVNKDIDMFISPVFDAIGGSGIVLKALDILSRLVSSGEEASGNTDPS